MERRRAEADLEKARMAEMEQKLTWKRLGWLRKKVK